jgi:hypothetical protein
MLRIAIALAALSGTPALATEWVHCADAAGAASFDYLAGDGLGVLSITGMTISVGEKVWASDVAYGPGDPTSVGQAFEDDQGVQIDAMDKDFALLARLRLVKASYNDTPDVYGGTLWIVGQGAWAVACDGQ